MKIKVAEVELQEKTLKIDPPFEFVITKEKSYFLYSTTCELELSSYCLEGEDLLSSINNDIKFLWREYCESKDPLSQEAIVFKEKLLKRIKKV